MLTKYYLQNGFYEEPKQSTDLRAQENVERLADIISEIRESAQLLRILFNEPQLIQTIQTILLRVSPAKHPF